VEARLSRYGDLSRGYLLLSGYREEDMLKGSDERRYQGAYMGQINPVATDRRGGPVSECGDLF
jgi:hypothetical protein